MSICSNNPYIGSRSPKLIRAARSTSDESAIPSLTICAVSRISAMCIRLPNWPGVSFFTTTGAFPQDRNKSLTRSAKTGEVRAPITISTNGIKCGGFPKCVVITRSGRAHRSPIAVIFNPEVFEVNNVEGAVNSPSRSNISCLNA